MCGWCFFPELVVQEEALRTLHAQVVEMDRLHGVAIGGTAAKMVLILLSRDRQILKDVFMCDAQSISVTINNIYNL